MSKFYQNNFELDVLIRKAKTYIEQKKYNLALAELKKIIAIKPCDEEAHFELGKTYYIQNRITFAIKELEETKRINPLNIQSHLLLAKIYKSIRQHDLAIEEIKCALNDPSFDADFKKEIADIYPEYIKEIRLFNFSGEYDRAFKSSQKIIEFIPKEDIFSHNKVKNELEIAQKNIVLDSKMRNLIVTLSTKCNLNCTMCEEIRLLWDIPKKTLEEVISLFPYLERVVWQGGEVFLLDYFSDLVKTASKFPQLRQVITTNGLLISERWAELLAKSNVDLTFSIDGVTKDTYENIRKGARFETLIRNLRNFNALRKKISPLLNINLHVVVMRSNYHQLENFIEFAKEYEFKLLALLPIGGNFDNPENIFYFKSEKALNFLKENITKIKNKAEKYGIILENRLPLDNQKDNVNINCFRSGDKANHSKNKMLCHLPWIQLYIDYDGSIRPDCVCKRDRDIGNVSENSLMEVWNNQKMQLYRQKIINNSCNDICNSECTEGRVSERYLKFS